MTIFQTDTAITSLRQHMHHDMVMRGLGSHTQALPTYSGRGALLPDQNKLAMPWTQLKPAAGSGAQA